MNTGTTNTRRFKGLLAFVTIAAGLWIGHATWQRSQRFPISASSPFRARLNARPRMRPGLSAVYVDLDVPPEAAGSLVFRVRELRLGTTANSYRWDWQAGHYPSSNFSFVDLSKRVQQDGSVTAWDIDVAVMGQLRLKIWRDSGETWQVVAQSETVTAASGLNHFVSRPPLPVQRGDYIGLYTAAGGVKLTSPSRLGSLSHLDNQHAINLLLSANRGMQCDFPGDVTLGLKARAAPAPNPGYSFSVDLAPAPATPAIGFMVGNGTPAGNPPISLIDLDKMANQPGLLDAWDVVARGPGTMRLKIWRRAGLEWKVAAESAVENVAAGYNRFLLRPALPVQPGDYLGYSSVGKPVELYNWADASDRPSRGQLYVLDADLRNGVMDSALTHDSKNGNYSFRALYAPVEKEESPAATLQLLPGRRTYRVELPSRTFALDEEVEVSIEAEGSARAFLYPSNVSRVLGHPFIELEYGSQHRWPVVDVLLVVVTAIGSWSLLRRRRSRWELTLGALPAIAAILVWAQWVGGGPVAQLFPSAVGMLLLPGFVMLELVFPKVACRLDGLERAPLAFAISVGLWIGIAAVAYRIQCSGAAVIGGIMAFDLLGLAAVFFVRPMQHAMNSNLMEGAPSSSMTSGYRTAFLTFIAGVSMVMAYASQYQMSDYDVMFHLAGFRNIADHARITNCDNLLGPGSLSLPQYTANPWYLVGGLTTRLAHADVTWLYVFLTFLLTALVFLTFYLLLKTLLADDRLAVIGVMVGTIPWIYGMTVFWRIFWSFYLTFLPFGSSIAELILLPMSLAYSLRYIMVRQREDAVVMIILAIAAMGIHVEYLVHVPYLLVMVLIASMIPADTWRNRLRTLALAGTVGLLAVMIAYLGLSFPSRAPISPMTELDMLRMWKGKMFLQIGKNVYGADPKEYFLRTGWTVVLGLIAVILFIRFRIRTLVAKRSRGWLGAILLVSRKKATARLAAGVVMAVVAPWLLVFNVVLVPWLVRLLHSTVPFYRMLGSAGAFARVVELGGLACLLTWTLDCRFVRLRVRRGLILAAVVVSSIVLPLSMSAVREAVTGALANYGWYPSLLDLPNESLYRELNRLEPASVAVRSEQAIITAALTPLHPIFVAGDRLGDYRLADERGAANERILNFSVSPEQMRILLNEYCCHYVIISINSPYLSRFRSHPELFREVFKSEADAVFSVSY